MVTPGLRLKVTSAQQSSLQPGPRQWHVAVEADLAGTPLKSSEIPPLICVSSKCKDVKILRLDALVSSSAAVYLVKETSSSKRQQDLEVQVTSKPKDLYKLEPGLAEIVGCTYLQRPKFALTLVLSYIKANHLLKEKSVVCDETLQRLLGFPCHIKTVDLWMWLQKLVKKIDYAPFGITHKLVDSTNNCPLSSHVSTKNFQATDPRAAPRHLPETHSSQNCPVSSHKSTDEKNKTSFCQKTVEDKCSLKSIECNLLNNLDLIVNTSPSIFKCPRSATMFLNPSPAIFKAPRQSANRRCRPDTPRKLSTTFKPQKPAKRTLMKHCSLFKL